MQMKLINGVRYRELHKSVKKTAEAIALKYDVYSNGKQVLMDCLISLIRKHDSDKRQQNNSR